MSIRKKDEEDGWFDEFRSFRRFFRDYDRLFEKMFEDFEDSLPVLRPQELMSLEKPIQKEIKKGNMKGFFKVQPIRGEGVTGYIAYGELSSVQTPTRTPTRAESLQIVKEDEPLVDVLEEKDAVKVVAEIHGVSMNDIALNMRDNHLEIKAGEKFTKKIEIPKKVDFARASISYKNGILQLRLPKIS